MTILEHTPAQEEILDVVAEGVLHLQSSGTEPRYIVVGRDAYERLRNAIADRFHRSPGSFETYNHLPIILDPSRTDEVMVLPAPAEIAKGSQFVRTKDYE